MKSSLGLATRLFGAQLLSYLSERGFSQVSFRVFRFDFGFRFLFRLGNEMKWNEISAQSWHNVCLSNSLIIDNYIKCRPRPGSARLWRWRWLGLWVYLPGLMNTPSKSLTKSSVSASRSVSVSVSMVMGMGYGVWLWVVSCVQKAAPYMFVRECLA